MYCNSLFIGYARTRIWGLVPRKKVWNCALCNAGKCPLCKTGDMLISYKMGSRNLKLMLHNYPVEKTLTRCKMIKIQSAHCCCTFDYSSNCTRRNFTVYTPNTRGKVLYSPNRDNTPTFHVPCCLMKARRNEGTYTSMHFDAIQKNYPCHLKPTKVPLSEEAGTQFKQEAKVNSAQDWKICFLRAEVIFPRRICAHEKTTPARPLSPFEMTYFSSIFFKFCALDWPLRAWQFVCVRKIFNANYILSSLDSAHQNFQTFSWGPLISRMLGGPWGTSPVCL